MATCDEAAGAIIIPVASLGSLCIVEAENQEKIIYNLPTAGAWFKSNWYVIFLIVLIASLSLVAVAFQALRWCRRIKHRHLRAERSRRVDGMVTLMQDSFRFVRLASAAGKRTSRAEAREEEGEKERRKGRGSRSKAGVPATRSSPSGGKTASDESPLSSPESDGEDNASVETSPLLVDSEDIDFSTVPHHRA